MASDTSRFNITFISSMTNSDKHLGLLTDLERDGQGHSDMHAPKSDILNDYGRIREYCCLGIKFCVACHVTCESVIDIPVMRIYTFQMGTHCLIDTIHKNTHAHNDILKEITLTYA